jgi:hypothetical protein
LPVPFTALTIHVRLLQNSVGQNGFENKGLQK